MEEKENYQNTEQIVKDKLQNEGYYVVIDGQKFILLEFVENKILPIIFEKKYYF